MSSSQPLTTGQVAKCCRVSSVAVWKWIKQGKLRAYRLPGGHYRIERGALKEFLREHNMPIDPEFFAVSRQRILVVDDEPATVEVVARALQRLGNDIDVATASDGFEAGMQLATFKPDLLVLDLMMPQIDGFEVCRAVRQNAATAHIKILIITAYGVHENIERAIQAGANDFVHKPLDMDQLLGKVREMLAA